MKKLSLLVLGLLATLLSGIGAHSLSNRVDPTARSSQSVMASANEDGGGLPCASCDYLPG